MNGKLQMNSIDIKKNRVFFNLANGCNKYCQYCYIPEMGYDCKILFSDLSGEDVIAIIEKNPNIKKGKRGDLFSIAPHAEPFLDEIIDKTFDWVGCVSQSMNPIQIATKSELTEEICYKLANVRRYKEQITLFISTSTITYSNIIEPNVTKLDKRLKSLELLDKYEIPYFLYIKPILPNITIQDKMLYANLMKKYKIKQCVVGVYYSNEKIDKKLNVNSKEINYETLNLKLPTGDNINTKPIGLSDVQIMYDFLTENTDCLILKSSPCAIANILDSFSPTLTWIRFPELCVNCSKNCNTLYQEHNNGNI